MFPLTHRGSTLPIRANALIPLILVYDPSARCPKRAGLARQLRVIHLFVLILAQIQYSIDSLILQILKFGKVETDGLGEIGRELRILVGRKREELFDELPTLCRQLIPHSAHCGLQEYSLLTAQRPARAAVPSPGLLATWQQHQGEVDVKDVLKPS